LWSCVTSTSIAGGGSVSATFAGADGIEYCLFFRISRSQQEQAESALRSYGEPLLEWFRTAEYRSPVTGDTSPLSIEDSAPITWAEARRILNELMPFYERFHSDDRRVFAEMVDAAAKDGRQPA
jgi:hypothetical protein